MRCPIAGSLKILTVVPSNPSTWQASSGWHSRPHAASGSTAWPVNKPFTGFARITLQENAGQDIPGPWGGLIQGHPPGYPIRSTRPGRNGRNIFRAGSEDSRDMPVRDVYDTVRSRAGTIERLDPRMFPAEGDATCILTCMTDIQEDTYPPLSYPLLIR